MWIKLVCDLTVGLFEMTCVATEDDSLGTPFKGCRECISDDRIRVGDDLKVTVMDGTMCNKRCYRVTVNVAGSIIGVVVIAYLWLLKLYA